MNPGHIQQPVRRPAFFQDWAPNIHYAQYQTVAPRTFPGRRLYDFELLYVCHGRLDVTIQGEAHSLLPGQLILLPSGVYHQNTTAGVPTTKLIGIHFDFFGELSIAGEEDMVVPEGEGTAGKYAAEAVDPSSPPLSEDLIYLPSHGCVQAMENLIHEFAMRPLGYALVCRGLMLTVLASLLRSRMSGRVSDTTVHGQRIKEIMAEMESKPAAPWSNTSLAERLGMSGDYSTKLFRHIAGVPPVEYLRSIRHREARRLLRETDWPIERIGEYVGYADIHYFSRLFRSIEGMSPRNYRKLSRVL
ncbi:AraC family transcriptional regulator [Gorillibacterium sp. sgz5001074]|uniref:AraC family transcriptional regulator n=1 Tax=Gorillibacterium sp. sgz5001074 TaxID=3446695 RepID=UPI003F66B515